EGRQFAEVGQEAPQGLPHCPAQGARLCDQQDEPAVQGPPGLISRPHPKGCGADSFAYLKCFARPHQRPSSISAARWHRTLIPSPLMEQGRRDEKKDSSGFRILPVGAGSACGMALLRPEWLRQTSAESDSCP